MKKVVSIILVLCLCITSSLCIFAQEEGTKQNTTQNVLVEESIKQEVAKVEKEIKVEPKPTKKIKTRPKLTDDEILRIKRDKSTIAKNRIVSFTSLFSFTIKVLSIFLIIIGLTKIFSAVRNVDVQNQNNPIQQAVVAGLAAGAAINNANNNQI